MSTFTSTSLPATGRDGPTGSPTVHRLLDRELEFSPAYHVHYSDHLAMMLAALDQMGAPPSDLEARYADRLRSGDGDPRQDVPELERRLHEVAELGIAETVRRRLPGVTAAPATALFHPAIRLAYGLDLGHHGQVAAALLDWESRFEPLPVPGPATTARRTLHDAAGALAAQPAGTWTPTFDLAGIARRAELATAIDGLDLDRVTLDDVAEFALDVHLAADDFTSLHMVTGARALHRIGTLVDEQAAHDLAREAAKAMIVLHAAVGAPPLAADDDRVRSTPLPSRAAIAAAAIAATDPHDIKLANVALTEEERTGDVRYRYIGARVLGLV